MAKKSQVNKAGNYTKPGMRKRLFKSILARNVQGTAAGKWSEKHNYLRRCIKQEEEATDDEIRKST